MYCGRHGKGKQVAANAVPFSVLPLEVSIHVASREGTDIPTPPQFQPYVVCLKHESRICCSMLGGMKLHTSCSSLSSQFPLQPRPPIPKRGCARLDFHSSLNWTTNCTLVLKRYNVWFLPPQQMVNLTRYLPYEIEL